MAPEFKSQLQALGWSAFDEEGSILAEKPLNDRRLLIDLSDVERCMVRGATSAQLHAYLCFDALRGVEDAIVRPIALASYRPWHVAHHFSVPQSSQWRRELESSVNRAEDWARSIRLKALLDVLAVERPDRPSNTQINHLIALAFRGQFDVLKDYSSAFAQGRHLNFVPLITNAVIDAALDVAYGRYAEIKTEQDAYPN